MVSRILDITTVADNLVGDRRYADRYTLCLDTDDLLSPEMERFNALVCLTSGLDAVILNGCLRDARNWSGQERGTSVEATGS